MNKAFKLLALSVLAGAASSVYADAATTAGGIKVKTEDGRFEANVNGRIQFDYYSFSEDDSAAFGSNTLSNGSGAAFRRAYLTLTGKAYGWDYKFENDFTASSNTGGSFREMWIGTNVGPGKLIIGQHKPFRGMEELASSNEITLIERPNTTATGIYAGRQFLTGLFYKGNTDTFGYGINAATLQNGTNSTEGHSIGARAYWFPLSADGSTVHVGLAYSSDREDATLAARGASLAAAPTFVYGGRRGATLGLGNAGSVFNTAAGTQNGNGTQNTIHGEIAGSFGSFTAQGEYAMATLENALGSAAAPSDLDVTAYYVQASYFITGEKKVYKKDRGAFGSPKPINAYGAVEAVLRYEASENDAGAADVEGSQITVGANWYVNPNVRFMLNYYLGEAENAAGAKDEPEAVTVRAQMSF